jgi:hypothetical protein
VAKQTTCDEDQYLINNRQNGRRRGRGSGGPRPNNAPSAGNRQDNRSRGNAAQLHEKYKSLARDSQLSGDRVQTEYFLQFADHYFRVLNENRPRFEEPRRSQGDFMHDDEEDGDEAGFGNEGEEQDERPQPQQQQARGDREFRPRRDYREEREPRGDREPREQRPEREQPPRVEREQPVRAEREQPVGAEREAREPRGDEAERPERFQRDEAPRRPRRRERQPEAEAEAVAPANDLANPEPNGEGRLSLDVLPPAISAEIVEVKPRRRTRRPRPEDESEIAPAA